MCGICGKLSKESICPKCNIMLKNQASYITDDYSQNSSYFDEHIYMFQYIGEIRNAILNYKFEGKSYIHETFVNFLKNNEKICNNIKSYDIIIPVPISKKRLKERGYNQSSIYAKAVAQTFKIQYEDSTLKKVKNNIPQSMLSQEDRMKNVQDVYEITNAKTIINKKILLIDDIFTTGSTANECSRVLIKADKKKIGVLTIAKD